MTLADLPALALLALVCWVFLRFGCFRGESSPARGHGAGLQGEPRRASLTGGPGARRPEVES